MTDPKSERRPLVLIANDQEWSARSLESILAPNGFTVLRAYTGQQALQRARTAAPDLIILDAQMPDLQSSSPLLDRQAGPSASKPTGRGHGSFWDSRWMGRRC